jgi:TPP-dependent 2-oxoacid decarboxylase
MLLIIYQGINSIQLFRRYKQEQLAAIQNERAQIEEERRQSVEMMKELQALKEQLAQKDASAEPAETVESVAEDTVADSSSDIEE